MRFSVSRFLMSSVVLALVGCAASGGNSNLQTYRDQIGAATPGDLAAKTRVVFQRHRFRLERQDSSVTYQTYESRWEGRNPFQDEIDAGVTEAMTRLIVRGRARGGGSRGGADVRQVEFVAENQVRLGEATEWTVGFITPMFNEFAKEIANELKTEIEAGIRVF